MAKKKKVDPIKQREKRVKIAAAVGGLLLIGVAAIEVPAVMTSLNRKPPVSPSAVRAAAAAANGTLNPDGTLPLPTVAGPDGATASSDGLTDTDAPPTASSVGQLVSFDVFEMKNPFTPQVSSAPAPADSSPAPTTPGAVVPGTTTPTSTTPTSTTPAATTPTTTTPTPATTPAVAISVNGSVSKVSTAGTFPTGSPVFRLVSWQHGTAEIGIVGGSYSAGGQTLTLRLNVPVTLQNTHDGKQYKLLLVSTP
jgi:hypothetical protein